jgi:dTDP-4-amino-4,6-dideoxygalactose transaminase
LANTEIPFIDQKNARRRRHAASYQHALWTSLVSVERWDQAIEDVYLRCVYLVQEEQRNALEQKLKANKVYPGDWYQQVVAPKWVDFDAIGYRQWSCPVAEKIAAMTLNIPNHAGISDAWCQKVIGILQQ